MKNFQHFRDLVLRTKEYQNDLVDLVRSISKVNDLFTFIDMCIDFAERNLDEKIVNKWITENKPMSVLNERINYVFTVSATDANRVMPSVYSTAGTAVYDAHNLLVSNYQYLENKEVRQEFLEITTTYKDLLINYENQHQVSQFLYSLNPIASTKYLNGTNQLQSIKPDEDPQGPLMLLRSALELTVISLLDRAGLTKKSISELQRDSAIPTIANKLAKDEFSKIDLILINESYKDLWKKLSATKNIVIDRDRAIGIALQITSILNLISKTISL